MIAWPSYGFFRPPAGRAPKLQQDETVPMHAGAHFGRTGIESDAHHPPYFTMAVYTCADKFCPHGHHKTAFWLR